MVSDVGGAVVVVGGCGAWLPITLNDGGRIPAE